MKKTLFLSSLLIMGLSTNACVKKNINTQTYPEVFEQPITQVPQATVNHSSSGVSHHLKTVQGPIVIVNEKSTGFVFPQYQNKVILLQIFGKECEYCFDEMPLIKNVQQSYAHKLNIVALQAQNNMTPMEAQNIIRKFNMNYPIIDKEEARSLLFFIKSTYAWNGILPYTLLIKDGVTEYSFEGRVNHQELHEAIQSLL